MNEYEFRNVGSSSGFDQSPTPLHHLQADPLLVLLDLPPLGRPTSEGAAQFVQHDVEEVDEGKEERHTKDGDEAMSWVPPVKNGVYVGLVLEVGAALLQVGEVGEGVDQREEDDVVGVEAAPGPPRQEEVHRVEEGEEGVASDVLKAYDVGGGVVEEGPVDCRAEQGQVRVDVGEDPQKPVRAWQPRPCRGVSPLNIVDVLLSSQLSPPPLCDEAGLKEVGEAGEESAPVGEVEEVLPRSAKTRY